MLPARVRARAGQSSTRRPIAVSRVTAFASAADTRAVIGAAMARQ